jgi:hypothetical protein
MPRDLSRFLRLLCVLDGRTPAQLLTILDCSRATLKRAIAAAKALGVEVAYERELGKGEVRYKVKAYGPFDVQQLRRARFPV